MGSEAFVTWPHRHRGRVSPLPGAVLLQTTGPAGTSGASEIDLERYDPTTDTWESLFPSGPRPTVPFDGHQDAGKFPESLTLEPQTLLRCRVITQPDTPPTATGDAAREGNVFHQTHGRLMVPTGAAVFGVAAGKNATIALPTGQVVRLEAANAGPAGTFVAPAADDKVNLVANGQAGQPFVGQTLSPSSRDGDIVDVVFHVFDAEVGQEVGEG